MIRLPDLSIRILASEPEAEGRTVRLEQGEYSGDGVIVDVHESQLRLIAEQLGLLPATDHDAQRTIARLTRQLRALHERIAFLDNWLHTCSDTSHADLDYEQSYSQATLAIADEFIADLPAAQPTQAATESTIGSPSAQGAPRHPDLLGD